MLTRKTILTIVIAVCTCWAGPANALYPPPPAACDGLPSATGQVPPGTVSPEPAYKPGEVIVKFRAGVADRLQEQLAAGRGVGELRLSGTLDNINLKYRASSIKPLIKGFKAKRERTQALLMKDKALLTPREKHLVRRLQRAPAGAKVPDLGRIYKIELEPGQSAPQAVAEYTTDPDVEYAELNYIVSIMVTEPNDPNYYPEQWALNNDGSDYPIPGGGSQSGTAGCDINAPDAWDITTGSSDVIVAVVDTGVDYTHRDLQANMWVDSSGLYGYDFYHDDNDPMDDNGHGTHCSGIIAADSNNGLDIAGVSWNGKIMALKFLGPYGRGWISEGVAALYYAVNNGADVISNSWGSYDYSQSLEDAIDYAYSQGVIIVASAGNEKGNTPPYPAGYDHVIAVAATDSNDDKATFSNYGNWVHLAAPGVHVLSLHATGTDMYADGEHFYPHGDTSAPMYIASGTSMACPHVSGACALLLSVNPHMTPDDANNILLESVDVVFDPNDEICRSNGRLNAYNAVLAAVPSKGYVSLDRNYYNCASNVGISLADYDLAGAGTQDVNVTTTGGDFETLTLSETDPNSGIFTGVIWTDSGDPSVGDGILQVADGDTITVSYEDANDGTGNPASPNDTATVDCIDPNITSDVNLTVVGPDVRVTFQTSGYTEGRVIYGPDCNNLSNSNIDYATDHSIKLVPILPWTDYYFKVEATDLAGNKVTDDNDGNYYNFTTDGPRNINVPADYNTIQEAIDVSWHGGTVTVAPGTYYEWISFKGKAITVTGRDPGDWDVVKATIIDGNELSTVWFQCGETPESVLTGFTVKSVINLPVICRYSSNPIIANCILEGTGRGVMCAEGSSPFILNNRFSNANIGCGMGSPVIRNNWMVGGGISFVPFGKQTIENNTIVGTTRAIAKPPGTAELIIRNCIFWGNGDDLAGGLSATYSCIEDVNDSNGEGNITSDPCFVHIFEFDDVTVAEGTTVTVIVGDANLYEVNDVIEYGNDGTVRTVNDVNLATNAITFGPPLDSNSQADVLVYNWGAGVTDVDEDLHLKSPSLCINTGDPNGDYSGQTDIDGQPRVLAGRVDMGTDEFSGIFNLDQQEWYDTIQDAIGDANDSANETIEVGPGTYYETIDFVADRAVTLRSGDPNAWSVVATTIIDADGSGTVVTFDSSEDGNSVLVGFTITGGDSGSLGSGGGIYCYQSSPTIRNCIITGNSAGWGGGLENEDASPTVTDCVFHSNAAEYGGGGMDNYDGSSPRVTNCLFYDNTSLPWGEGGAICNMSSPPAVITNCTLYGNSTCWGGGGIENYDASPLVTNCILWDNTAIYYEDEVQNLGSSDPNFSHCDIEGCGGSGGGWDPDFGTDGGGNIDSDPCFVDSSDADGADNIWATCDDGLGISSNSPCKDEGNNDAVEGIDTDIKGSDRIINDDVDMGAYEYDPGC
ncbi:MAG TPA: S8 family serine peptidase [Sedimentisphaerales bacterium]|nr:S8 family serine peptidase [Sedimentisphaerales bacterium]